MASLCVVYLPNKHVAVRGNSVPSPPLLLMTTIFPCSGILGPPKAKTGKQKPSSWNPTAILLIWLSSVKENCGKASTQHVQQQHLTPLTCNFTQMKQGRGIERETWFDCAHARRRQLQGTADSDSFASLWSASDAGNQTGGSFTALPVNLSRTQLFYERRSEWNEAVFLKIKTHVRLK